MLYLAQLAQPTPDPTAVMAGLAAMSGVFVIMGLVFVLFTILVYFFIVKRTGYNPWLSLLMLVPLANFVLLIILAFTEWPVQRENKQLRQQFAAAGGGGYPGAYPPPPPAYPGAGLPPPPIPPAPAG